MGENAKKMCVLLPFSATETWAVPQQCLGEIVTVQSESEVPPTELEWRGKTIPVIDLGAEEGPEWREKRRGSGLVAIFLGLSGEACEYWGMAVRGKGLRMVSLTQVMAPLPGTGTNWGLGLSFRMKRPVAPLDVVREICRTRLFHLKRLSDFG